MQPILSGVTSEVNEMQSIGDTADSIADRIFLGSNKTPSLREGVIS